MNKLKYHISQTTHLETPIVIDNIRSQLNEKNYHILHATRNSVTFNDRHSGVMWNLQALGRLNSGKFEIIDDGHYTIVIFDYHPFALYELPLAAVVALAFSIFALTNINYFVSVITTGFLIQMIIRNYNLKAAAKKMLNEVSRNQPAIHASLHQ